MPNNGKEPEDVDTQVAQAVDELSLPADNLIRLSSGVILRGKQAPPLAMIKVIASFKRPEPPTYFNKTMGREMENPDDPDYLARVQAYEMQYANAMTNALILLGTELVEVPKKFPRPEDDSWLEEYELIGTGTPTKPDSKNWRYLVWVNFKAILSKEDMTLLQTVVGRLSGVPNSAVQSAETFPGSKEESR